MMASMIPRGPGNGDGDGPRLGVENGVVGKTDSVGVGKVGSSVGIVTMDVIVVTTGGPGNEYVSRGAR